MIPFADKQLDRVTVQHVDTPRSVIISSDGLQISNENWFFESVKANQGVSKTLYSSEHPDGWYYEVIVLTDGILQIGKLPNNLNKYDKLSSSILIRTRWHIFYSCVYFVKRDNKCVAK